LHNGKIKQPIQRPVSRWSDCQKGKGMTKYYINGFREGENYFNRTFKSHGATEQDRKKLERGEVVVLQDDEFYMEVQE